MQKRTILAFFGVLLAACVLCLAWVYVNRERFFLLDPVGPVAAQEKYILLLTVLLSGLVVVPVFGMLFWFSLRYRSESEHATKKHARDWDHTHLAEIVCWIVPTIIIVFLSILAWRGSYALDPYKALNTEPPLRVQVVALNWKWLFIYPDEEIATLNYLRIPMHRQIVFQITADAPMNSFWVPQLGGQIMAMPGMETKLHMLADRVGTFNGFSANISGEGFSGMAFAVESISPEDFDAWVATMKQGSATLSSAQYAQLVLPSGYVPRADFVLSETGLFDSIIMKYMMPAHHHH